MLTVSLSLFPCSEQYAEFIDEMVIQPGKTKYDSNRCDVTMEDHVSMVFKASI